MIEKRDGQTEMERASAREKDREREGNIKSDRGDNMENGYMP